LAALKEKPVLEHVKKSKIGSLFANLFRFVKEPSKLPTEERQVFIDNTAGAVRLCKDQGWELPDIND